MLHSSHPNRATWICTGYIFSAYPGKIPGLGCGLSYRCWSHHPPRPTLSTGPPSHIQKYSYYILLSNPCVGLPQMACLKLPQLACLKLTSARSRFGVGGQSSCQLTQLLWGHWFKVQIYLWASVFFSFWFQGFLSCGSWLRLYKNVLVLFMSQESFYLFLSCLFVVSYKHYSCFLAYTCISIVYIISYF